MAQTKEQKAAYMRQWRIDNPEAAHANDRTKHERHREARLARQKRWRTENPRKAQDTSNRSTAAWRERNRDKTRAHDRVRYALRTGRLVRGPCEQAGADCEGKIHAHHDDYSKPLEVRWLCAKHHRVKHGTQLP